MLYGFPNTYIAICYTDILLSACGPASAQGWSDAINNPSIQALEGFMQAKTMLDRTAKKLDSIKRKSQKTGDDLTYMRARYDLLQVRDMRTEDTLFFRNSAFLDTLIDKAATAKIRALAHLLRAKRLAQFNKKYLRFNFAAYSTADPRHNYVMMTVAQRDSQIRADLDEAYRYKGDMGAGKQLLWLSSSPDVFLYEPAFKDIILSEKVNWLTDRGLKNERAAKRYIEFLRQDQEQFKASLSAIIPREGTIAAVLDGYREWVAMQQDEGKAAFIASLARKFLFQTNREDSIATKNYISYLSLGATSPYPELKAHAIYQLCLLWNSQSYEYLNNYEYYRYKPNTKGFDPRHQYLSAKALALFEKDRQLMQRYPVFYNVLDAMARQILSKGVRAELEDKQLPQQAIRFRAVYRNTDALFYRVVRVAYGDSLSRVRSARIKQLLAGHIAGQGSFKLPLPPDHNSHAVFLKLPALPAGRYYLLFGDKAITPDDDGLKAIPFDVTAIAAINTDEQIFVMDRKTGSPIAGAEIMAYKKNVPVFKNIPSATNGRGVVNIPAKLADSIIIMHGADTAGYKVGISSNKIPDGAFDKESDDSLDEFYDDEVELQIFTDRAIYRPGQTVHYKIIYLTNNKRTGDKMLFNEANLGGGLFSSRLKKWLSDPDHSKIFLRNSFRKYVDSAVVTINKFGSFAGSFTLPKNAGTGSWDIYTDPNVSYLNDGIFKVEEYKRPTLELTMEKRTKMLKQRQPFDIVLKLRSFSGAQINGTTIKYTVSRSGYTVHDEYYGDEYSQYPDTLLISGAGTTDSKGKVTIAVNDTALLRSAGVFKNMRHNYHINATATDATGETVELHTELSVIAHPIRINIPMITSYDRQQMPLIRISAEDEFEGEVGRMVSLKVYKVSDPKIAVPEANKADQWYYNKKDWDRWFPDVVQDGTGNDQKLLVFDTLINTASYQKFLLPKARFGVGFYRIEASCTDDGVITGRRTESFSIFDSGTRETPAAEFDHLPK